VGRLERNWHAAQFYTANVATEVMLIFLGRPFRGDITQANEKGQPLKRSRKRRQAAALQIKRRRDYVECGSLLPLSAPSKILGDTFQNRPTAARIVGHGFSSAIPPSEPKGF
jgi:hypothetical protein